MNADRAIAVTPVLVAELHVEGEVMPVCVHVMEAVQSVTSAPSPTRASS